jgi:hypothetical protein
MKECPMRRRDLMMTAGLLTAGALAIMSRRIATAAQSPASSSPTAPSQAVPSPVVLELFTSQGCSSCPPADALLTELAPHPNIVALTWHVDYWNNRAWRDPYARPEWTARQRQYADALQTEVYTPALAVNGTKMLVGSDRASVRAAITDAPVLIVPVTLQRTDAGLAAQIGARPDAALVTLVVYDPARATSVDGGENAGRTLKETHIVRSATPVPTPAGAATLSLPAIPGSQGAVLLIQDRNLGILGAAQVRAAGEAIA